MRQCYQISHSAQTVWEFIEGLYGHAAGGRAAGFLHQVLGLLQSFLLDHLKSLCAAQLRNTKQSLHQDGRCAEDQSGFKTTGFSENLARIIDRMETVEKLTQGFNNTLVNNTPSITLQSQSKWN